jgi:DNA-binding Lrp family transcriptional regulator
MFNKKLTIDEVDKTIITLLQSNPDMTHSEIAAKVHKSQPAVGARIIKLKRKNLICKTVGVNFRKVDIKIAKVEMMVKNVSEIMTKIEQCPFVLHAFKISGNYNLCIMISAPDIQTVDKMVDLCYRSDPNVFTINVSYIISSVKDLIMPINFDIEHFDEFGCGQNCHVRKGEMDKLKRLIKESKDSALKKEIAGVSEET